MRKWKGKMDTKKTYLPSAHAHADLSGFHSQITNRASIYDSHSTTFLSPTLYCRRRGGGGNKGTCMYHIDTKEKFLLDHWLSQSPYHPGWQSKCVTNMCTYVYATCHKAILLSRDIPRRRTEQALYLPVLSLACLLARIHDTCTSLPGM